MTAAPIIYYHRYHKREETEAIYGDRWLRWTYETPFGRLALNAVVKRAIFSRWYGWRMDRRSSRALIGPFIRQYSLYPEEFKKSLDQFRNFNEFFYRELVHGARPICSDPQAVVFPADGRHLGFQDIADCPGLFVKGQKLDVRTLLGSAELGDRYHNATAVISRLCPVDYHRFHFPAAGFPEPARRIGGPLFSVSPVALRRNIDYLVRNKREVTIFRTEKFGTVACVEVGATCVGGIIQTFRPGERCFHGEEKGYFRFGGSCVITLFEPGRVRLADDLLAQSARQIELYARIGDKMGERA